MKKAALKTVCICLCALMLAGCGDLPFFDSSDIAEIGDAFAQVFGNENVSVVEQYEIVEYTVEVPMCYFELNSTQKRMYRIMATAAEDMVDGWISLGKCDDSYEHDAAIAYRALTCDNPEYFWLPNNYLISNRGKGNSREALIAFNYSDGKNRCEYSVTAKERDTMLEQLHSVVDSYVSEAKKISNSFDKEVYIHDRLCDNTAYNESGGKHIYSAYGALVEGVAVCEGYSRAMQLICEEVGIPCIIVYGSGHMWNLINPGDSWYNLDVTWDDGDDILHTYFNLTDTEIGIDHTAAPTYTASGIDASESEECYNFFDFSCQSNLLNYFEYTEAVFEENMAVAARKVAQASKDGKKYAQLKITDSDLYEEFSADHNVPIARLQEKLYRKYGVGAPSINAVSTIGKCVTLYWE